MKEKGFKREAVGMLAIVLCFVLIPLHAKADHKEESSYPAVTYTSLPGTILISVEGVHFGESLDFTWNGESISKELEDAIDGGLMEIKQTPLGFELLLSCAPDMVGMVGDGVFGILLPTGATISVPIIAETIVPATSAAKVNGDAVSAYGACAWLTVSAPTSISPNKSCLYGGTNCAKRGWYHTGIDYSGSGDAKAAANGTVVRVERMSSGDHGMGNNVIIKHILSNCSAIYSTYSHLGSIDSKMVVGKTVVRGQKVGAIGGSGYGKSSYWGKHLHFEMKSSPVTGSPCGGTYWGYTPSWPDGYGYSNPSNYIGK
jgi:hypothetical protein